MRRALNDPRSFQYTGYLKLYCAYTTHIQQPPNRPSSLLSAVLAMSTSHVQRRPAHCAFNMFHDSTLALHTLRLSQPQTQHSPHISTILQPFQQRNQMHQIVISRIRNPPFNRHRIIYSGLSLAPIPAPVKLESSKHTFMEHITQRRVI